MSKYIGIDYSMGTANFDPSSGCHFGIISQHAVSGWFYDSLEAHFTPYCPWCGNELTDDWEDTAEEKYLEDGDNETEWIADDALPCPHCSKPIHDGDQWPEEPDSQTFDEDGSSGFLDNDGDIWVTKSDFYTKAQFCSPCAPGAGHLENPCEDGVKTFCLDHSWFEEKRAPYPVYRVDNDELVLPEKEQTNES